MSSAHAAAIVRTARKEAGAAGRHRELQTRALRTSDRKVT
jgi:hypothetical protein